MSYPEIIKYLESFINYEKIPAYPYKASLKLERIRGLLDTIDNPQANLRCIHVAGTKGKGSTCAFIAYILREAGFKVGLYTSPHLSDFRERIRILNPKSQTQKLEDFEGMIPKDKLADLTIRLKPFIENYNKNSQYGPLSFFEAYTALAFVYFKENKIDFAVLETGLGGRLDATNVVSPYVAAITPISYEHTQKLGNTLREIATEKAGIIKALKQAKRKAQNLIVISAPQENKAMEVIENRCKKAGAKLYEVGKDIVYGKTKEGVKIKGIFGDYPGLKVNLLGGHQLINATVAVGAIEALGLHNINVGIDAIKAGLYNTVWPGRCEVISKNPLIVLDGAQNVASAKVLKKAIKENFSARGGSAVGGKYKRLILILGISQDKDIKGICIELKDLADEIILTKANNPRASSPEALAKYFNGKVVRRAGSVKEAGKILRRIATKKDLILVTGSLFVVGEFRNDKIRHN